MHAQEIKWEKTDSVSKTKAQIYSDTKLFIVDYWKSSKDVTQHDDKDGGIIMVKGLTEAKASVGLSQLIFYYSYTVKFLMKDGKYKIIVQDVLYHRGPSKAWDPYDLRVQETHPGLGKSGMSKKAWKTLMSSVKTQMEAIVYSYEKYIKSPSLSSDW